MKLKNLTFLPMLVSLAITTSAVAQQALEESFYSGYAPVNGLKMYYEIHQPAQLADGGSKPIVLLHGSFMTIDMNWGQLIPELTKTRKVIVLEMQGHGRTADIDRGYSYPSLASDVAGLLKYLKIDHADILGYSLGGTVAFQLAIQNPELVDKLVLISTVFKYDGWMSEVTNTIRTFEPTALDNTPLFTEYEKLAPDPSYWHSFMEKMLQFENTYFDLGVENVKSITSPALLITRDNDGLRLEHVAEMFRSLGGGVFGDIAGLPKSQLAIVPGATHVSVMMETQKLVSMINPFLDDQPTVGHQMQQH